MGGESLQITFVPDKSILDKIPNKLLIYLELFDVKIPIFTHSYMHIGMQAAQTKYDTHLVTKGIFDESACYINGDIRNRDEGKKSYSWKGKGNFDECLQGLSNIINNDKTTCQSKKKLNDIMVCVPNGLTMPKIVGKQEFYYIENFYYTAKVLGTHIYLCI